MAMVILAFLFELIKKYISSLCRVTFVNKEEVIASDDTINNVFLLIVII